MRVVASGTHCSRTLDASTEAREAVWNGNTLSSSRYGLLEPHLALTEVLDGKLSGVLAKAAPVQPLLSARFAADVAGDAVELVGYF